MIVFNLKADDTMAQTHSDHVRPLVTAAGGANIVSESPQPRALAKLLNLRVYALGIRMMRKAWRKF